MCIVCHKHLKSCQCVRHKIWPLKRMRIPHHKRKTFTPALVMLSTNSHRHVCCIMHHETLPRCAISTHISQRNAPLTLNLLPHVAYLVIRTQASWYSRFILASLFSLTHNIQPLTIPTNSSFWPILKFPFASIISESMMIYRLLFLAALLGIANAAESCYNCVSPIMKSKDF